MLGSNVMTRWRDALAIAALAAALVGMTLVAAPADASSHSPLDDGGWVLVAHMSDSGGMFDGNGELAAGYSYGTFVSNPVASTPDFQRAFPVVANEILFITGDGSVWGIADYGDLRALIDTRGNAFGPNLAFETNSGGTTGNVLSRNGVVEDPWISIVGDHSYGVNNSWIVWGENNYPGIHRHLKNNHGGINVFVKAADNVEPEIDLTTPANGAEYFLDAEILADYACSDEGSGVASCVGDVAVGSAIDTSTLGSYDFTVTATDNAGNSASVTHTYTVVANTPNTKGHCRKGGWRTFTDDEGTRFRNQGDCVSYVATGGSNRATG